MQNDFFKKDDQSYHVSSYFYRIEFQQRGAPHVHSLLWLKDKNNEDAPSLWIDQDKVGDNEQGDDEEVFDLFSMYCGLALHHAKLYDKIRQKEAHVKVF